MTAMRLRGGAAMATLTRPGRPLIRIGADLQPRRIVAVDVAARVPRL